MSEEIIVALITGGCGLLGGGGVSAVVSHFSTRRDRLSHAYNELAEAQLRMQSEIDAQDKKIDELKRKLCEVESKDDAKTTYLRSLFHWLARLCEVIDDEWLSRNPKPHLPDDLRPDIAPETMEG